jgi:hypothetical protein
MGIEISGKHGSIGASIKPSTAPSLVAELPGILISPASSGAPKATMEAGS